MTHPVDPKPRYAAFVENLALGLTVTALLALLRVVLHGHITPMQGTGVLVAALLWAGVLARFHYSVVDACLAFARDVRHGGEDDPWDIRY